MEMVAKTLFGLEELLMEELEQLGAENIRLGRRMVLFEGDTELLYKANLHLRTAIRVLLPIKRSKVHNEKSLYKLVQTIDWSQYINTDQTLAVNGVVNSNFFKHSQYIALKTKDAIVDQFRDIDGKRPSVDIDNPDLRINVHIRDEYCTISLDSSGDSLHKRGYKVSTTVAPLNEVLAAGMLMLSGWDKESPLVDPMCGSGSLPIEAALMKCNCPPNIKKSFGFQKWRDYDKELWDRIFKEAQDQIIEMDGPPTIYASDMLKKAYHAMQDNAKEAGVDHMIDIQCQKFEVTTAPAEEGLLVFNPPYGERIEPEKIDLLYRTIGDIFKNNYQGWTGWIISSNPGALKSVGLRTSRKIKLFNGALECRFNKYEMYRGTKKIKKDIEEEKDV